MSSSFKPAFKVANMMLPGGGLGDSKCITTTLDFTVNSSIHFDLELEQTQSQIDFVQTLYADNSLNLNALQFVFPGGQIVKVPAGAQGYYPITPAFGKFECTVSTTVAALLSAVQIQLLNVPIPAMQWGPITVNAVVTASMTPVQKNSTETTYTAADAADHIALAANAARTRVVFQAHPNNNGPVAYSYDAAATLAGSINLFPGQQFDSGTGPVDARAIHIIAANAGNVVIFQEQGA